MRPWREARRFLNGFTGSQTAGSSRPRSGCCACRRRVDNLIRASIIDNTERKRAERGAARVGRKVSRALRRLQSGVVLHDENQILEVNPAAVRIMGCQSPAGTIGQTSERYFAPFPAEW